MAEFASSEAGKKGGAERAKRLSKAERSEIARKGAEARWGKEAGAPKAIKEAPLMIGSVEFECAVLEDETRVISQRAFARAIGAKRGGSHWQRQKADPDGANLPVFLSAKNLRPFIDNDLSSALAEPTIYITEGGQRAFGIEAQLIPQILDVWLKARDEKKLTKSQKRFADLAEILMRGLAATGIVALIDEATGYQAMRDRDALAKILEAFVAKELRKWVKTFPPEYYRGLCRLWDVPYPPPRNQFPQYFGTLTNNIVYDRLAPGVKMALQRKNPSIAPGRRKHKHHQWLTDDSGHPALREHLSAVVALMDVAGEDKENFMVMLDKAKPKHIYSPLFDEPIEDDPAE